MKKFLIALVAAFTVGTLSFATDTTAPAADAQKPAEVKTDGAATTAATTETKTEEKTAKKGKKKKAEKKKAEETTM